MNKKTFLIILLLSLCFSLFSSNLKSEYISALDDNQLKNMAILYDLDASLSSSEIKNILLQDLEIKVEEKKESDNQVEIKNSDIISVNQDDKIILEGNVEINFISENITLFADKMLLDDKNSTISALGNVSYKDNKENATLQKLDADIVTFIYSTNELYITNGSTSTKRVTSEDEEVEFYTAGELLSYREANEGMFFQNGLITSNLEKSLSTIEADKLAILESGDMFLTNALIKIGRVPIFYLPAFFYPSSKLVFNPAFGFESNRGMFASFTYDIFGQNTNLLKSEMSSFASLLQVESDKSFISDGLFYKPNEKTNGFENWLAESNSYLSLMADIYQESGILLGYDTYLEYEDLLTLESNSALIYTGEEDSLYRYYSKTELDLDFDNINLSLDLPYFSDPDVYIDYANRLSKVTLDSFFFSNQDFPDEIKTDYDDFTISVDADIDIPTPWFGQYLKNLSINNITVETEYEYKDDVYEVEKEIRPAFDVDFSGTLLDYSYVKESKTNSFTSFFQIDNKDLKKPYDKTETLHNKIDFKIKYDFDHEYENLKEKDKDELITNDTNMDFDIDFLVFDYFKLDSSIKIENEINKNELFELSNNNVISIPILNLNYNFNALYYKNKDGVIESFEFNKDFITKNNFSIKDTYDFIYYGKLDYDLSYAFYPLDPVFKTKLSYSYSSFNVNSSVKVTDYLLKENEYTFGFSNKYDFTSYDINSEFDSDSYKITPSISIFDINKNYLFNTSLTYKDSNLSDLESNIDIYDLQTKFNFKNINDKLKINYMNVFYNLNAYEHYMWYNRIKMELDLNSSLRYNFINKHDTYFNLSLDFNFEIKEYLDFSLKFKTGNNNFNKYFDLNDKFSSSLLIEDLLNSLDILSGKNKHTNFNLQKIELGLIYFMHDWDFHFEYATSFKQEGYQYMLNPEFKIYLQWKTIPDLEVDEKWEYSVDGFKKVN